MLVFCIPRFIDIEPPIKYEEMLSTNPHREYTMKFQTVYMCLPQPPKDFDISI
jgi:hypothetical protein